MFQIQVGTDPLVPCSNPTWGKFYGTLIDPLLLPTEYGINYSELEITCHYSNSRAPGDLWLLTISYDVNIRGKQIKIVLVLMLLNKEGSTLKVSKTPRSSRDKKRASHIKLWSPQLKLSMISRSDFPSKVIKIVVSKITWVYIKGDILLISPKRFFPKHVLHFKHQICKLIGEK